jgi:hypothetical protein
MEKAEVHHHTPQRFFVLLAIVKLVTPFIDRPGFITERIMCC